MEKKRFECQDTCAGKCCKPWQNGQSTFVFLTKKDAINLSIHLTQPIHMFADRGMFSFTRFKDEPSAQWYLRPKYDGSCQFLEDGKCGVYKARPTQCRTFPFWPENMDKKSWESLIEHCPGINKWPILQEELIEEKLKEQRDADKKY